MDRFFHSVPSRPVQVSPAPDGRSFREHADFVLVAIAKALGVPREIHGRPSFTHPEAIREKSEVVRDAKAVLAEWRANHPAGAEDTN